MQVNDLIFKELVRRGYSLEGNTRIWNISDSKLWYLTPAQAKAYLDLLHKAKDYSHIVFDAEFNLLQKHLPDIADRVLHESAVNIIDIGCGDGSKTVPIVQHFHKETKTRYCPIDISSYMISQALDRMRKLGLGDVVQFQWNISDFDNLENVASLLRDGTYRQNLLLFLGNTISNFEFHEVMYEVAEAMNDELDYLVLGIPLGAEKGEAIAKSYRNTYVDDFLSLMLTQIGFARSDIEMGVRFRNSRIEVYYTIKKNRSLDLGPQQIVLHAGDQILTAVSRRYTEKEVRDSLKLYFDTTKFYLNPDKTHALVLCRK